MNLQDFLNLCGKFSSKRDEALKKNIGILLTYSKLFNNAGEFRIVFN